jgi:formamidopyrimidine-DNA glycosylase
MLEIPESKLRGQQADKLLSGKVVVDVVNATTPHKFTWFFGDPEEYGDRLVGKTIKSSKGHGMFVDIHFDSDAHLTVGDGTIMRYYQAEDKYPGKHQLILVLNDNSYIVFTVAMYGAIYVYSGILDNPYYQGSINSISPLNKAFNEKFFEGIFQRIKKDMSVKAFLATEQRIPGLGNGVLQDILFNARMNPKRKISTLSDSDKSVLFNSLKNTLKQMYDEGGRDTEKDILGKSGGYKTILSKNTYANPCPVCGDRIVKEAYLGGSVYYCPTCQPK